MLNELVAKQILDLQKTTFDNAFNAMVMWQDQAERYSQTLMDQNSWLPQESRQMADQWSQMIKNGRQEFKNMVNDGFDRLSDIYKGQAAASGAPKAAKPQPAKTAAQ